ncbi:hypothetical protein NQZ68_003071 [Dissostichus eleginoides]|nr:hypothetical protein NQZ68_003071 [Dissostichus eleginoides]
MQHIIPLSGSADRVLRVLALVRPAVGSLEREHYVLNSAPMNRVAPLSLSCVRSLGAAGGPRLSLILINQASPSVLGGPTAGQRLKGRD